MTFGDTNYSILYAAFYDNYPENHRYESGTKSEEYSCIDGMIQGLQIMWFESGAKMCEIPHGRNGLRDGLATAWYESGAKKTEILYKEDKEASVSTEWYENGVKKAEVPIRDGKEDGVAKYWDENGNMTTKTWKDGVEITN